MDKNITAFFVILGIAVMVYFGLSSTQNIIPKSVDAEYIQQKIDERLEENNSGEKFKLKYTINDLAVEITDDLIIYFDMNLKGYGKKVHVIGKAVGQPSFDQEKGVFYFKPTKEIEFEKFDVSEPFTSKLSFIDKINMSDSAIEEVAKNSALFYLKTLPVYKLKDNMKENIVGSTLTELEVKNGEIHFELTFKELAWDTFVFIFVIVLLILLLIAIARSGHGALFFMELIAGFFTALSH